MIKEKLVRVTTVPVSLHKLLHDQLKYMLKYFDVIGISSGGETLERVKKEQGVNVVPIEMTRTISPLRDLASLLKMYRVLKGQRPFIVHSHTPKAGVIGMLAAKLAGVPHRLHTVAGLPLMEVNGGKRILLNMVEKLTYACATKVYPNSYGLQKFILEEKFCGNDKLKVIGRGSSNGIDTQHFSRIEIETSDILNLKQSYNLDNPQTVFCFVGRLVGDKGINELVAAFCKVYTKDSNARLLLVGELEKELDPLLPETEKQIENHPGIVGVGWQEDVRPYLAISDVFVFPSYREGFPNVVMQAGAMELPCIVSNINGCNEIIEEGINGMIIPSKDENELYNAMLELLEKREKRELLASVSRQMIVERYEQQYVWESLLKEYKTLLEANKLNVKSPKSVAVE